MIDTVCFDFSVNSFKYVCKNLFFVGHKQLNIIQFMRHGLLLKSRCKPGISNILYDLQTAP